MPTVVIPSAESAVSDEDLVEVQLRLLLTPESFDGLYDQMEVWRSTLGSAGPFEELTAETWRPARVPAAAEDQAASPPNPSVVLSGLELELELNETEQVVITFGGADPLTYAQAAAQVDLQGLGKLRAYTDPNGQFVVEATNPGVHSSLRVKGGDAATALGLTLEEYGHGRDPRIPLSSSSSEYTFRDPLGRSTYFYKRRLRHSVTGALGEFSSPFSSTQAINIPSVNTVLGFVELSGADGRPLAGALVLVHNVLQSILLDGKLVGETQQVAHTDKNGRAEFVLLRGLKATVSISGTSIARDITVPTDTSIATFNLLGPEASGTDDVFKVQRPDIISAERRSWGG